jgi:hypothetical protein
MAAHGGVDSRPELGIAPNPPTTSVNAHRGGRDVAPRWQRVLPTPRRLAVWSTAGRSGMAATRVIYQPRRTRARLASAIVARAMPAVWSRAAPVPNIDNILEQSDTSYVHGAAVYAREPNRWLFALMESDTRGVVVKLGRLDDGGIRHEIETMTTLAQVDVPFRSAKVRWSGQADGWLALVTEIIARDGARGEAGLEDALTASCALAKTPLGFVVHGDLAPWNIVQTTDGLALVDWEASRFEEDPLFDLTHYVTRVGALVGSWKPETAVLHLTAPGSVGWRYLEALGLDARSAPEHVSRYLRRAQPAVAEKSLRRYEAAMADIVERRAAPRGLDAPSSDPAT